MTCASEIVVFISGASVDVDANAGEGIWKVLGGDPYSVTERRYLVELCWFLWWRRRKVGCCR